MTADDPGGVMDEERPARPTVSWRELAIREFRLAQLKRRVELVRDDGTAPAFCANAYWYGYDDKGPGVRDQLAALVGPQARAADPLLGTGAALAVASMMLRPLMPPCRGCGCANLAGLPDDQA